MLLFFHHEHLDALNSIKTKIRLHVKTLQQTLHAENVYKLIVYYQNLFALLARVKGYQLLSFQKVENY